MVQGRMILPAGGKMRVVWTGLQRLWMLWTRVPYFSMPRKTLVPYWLSLLMIQITTMMVRGNPLLMSTMSELVFFSF